MRALYTLVLGLTLSCASKSEHSVASVEDDLAPGSNDDEVESAPDGDVILTQTDTDADVDTDADADTDADTDADADATQTQTRTMLKIRLSPYH